MSLPKFTIQLSYDVPYLATVTVEAATLEEAKTLAMESEPDFEPCYDACSDTEIAGAWLGAKSYVGQNLITGEVEP